MFNINLLLKKFNKILLSINNRIESFFNRIKILIDFLKNKKKGNLKKINNKITLSAGLLLILFIVYFLIPTFYDKNLVKTELENQIIKKYNLEVKIKDKIAYRLFPKPHFFTKKIITTYDNNILAESDDTKIYISIKNFFLREKLKLKKLVFKKTEFNIDSNNIQFFKEILNASKSDNSIDYKNSILFYRNKNKDVIIIVDIKNLKFFQDEDLNQQLVGNFKVFNMPFYFNIINNTRDKKISTKLKSHKMRLNINNDIDYNNKNTNGLVEFKIINESKQFNYMIYQNSLSFNSTDDNFKGRIDFKPFYFLSELNFIQLDIKKIFEENSIFINLFNSEIFNNPNLNANINMTFNKTKGISNIKDIDLKIFFEEGNIILNTSNLNWNDSVILNFNDVQLFNQKNKFIITGSIIFDFLDITKFYSHYQIKRNYRKNIKKIKLDFLFNLDEKSVQVDNIKIDGISSKPVDDFFNKFNSDKINIVNKVVFKNLIRKLFIKYHEG